ncbi:Rieske (2Fe-2S) protein [Amycolatopsis echigonensis]|uniref:Rieske 2Fe-2S domain-containing protein n=1 Tax=Amycolatopsis echigonensis TaxID=2576905 RepID=A0A8E2B8L6_9PSEU|nr:Rieske 2Fe-2S domain-containing protein [Amycolatopsis echigonensis]MBB2505156.1 Rieske 2Fe-2S domain-containing protein [Amycolatopsis echigonensis]
MSGGVRVAALEEVPEDRFLIVDVEGTEVGIVRDGDQVHAVRNLCPHHDAPVCRGRVAGTMLPSAPGEMSYGLDRRVVVCPWHQFEFDLVSGRPLFTNVRGRIRTYAVTVDGSDVYVEPGRRPAENGDQR